MLVDDDDAVAGLGDDVGLVQLGAGGAEREVDRIEHGGGAGLCDSGWWLEAGRDLGDAGQDRLQRARPPAACAPRGEAGGRWGWLIAWPQPRQRLGRDGGGGAVAGASERVTQRADDQAADQRRIAEAHLGL